MHDPKPVLYVFIACALGLLALVGWWLGLPAPARLARLHAVQQAEQVATTPPATLEGQATWLVAHRLTRLQGLALLAQAKGKKLFVSGVHRGVDVQQLIDRSRRSPEVIDCCIVLGYAADHTAGNAKETADWMNRQGYTSLRLVTASYHMPRSLVEFRYAMPHARIIPNPVFPENVKVDEWWRWPGTAVLILGEYNKYLVADAGHRIGRLLNGNTGP